MRIVGLLRVVIFAVVVSAAAAAFAQSRGPYIGYAYPAGGQQGTTFSVRIGGQGLDGVYAVHFTGTGVTAKVVDYFGRLSPQDSDLLREQMNEFRKIERRGGKLDATQQKIRSRIESRISEYVNRPASASLSLLAIIEVTIAPDAPPGPREIRLVTSRGLSNPLVFHVGQYPEVARKPMKISPLQVLGKEEAALRRRPADEVEQRVLLPCVANGQIASGEENRYRFEAKKGQRLILDCQARSLIPFIADAVPGWFQPVLVVRDDAGKELAFNDDNDFRPDPMIFFEVPHDGEYVVSITDAIYRGREDFIYRLTIGEIPYLAGIYPLGGKAGSPFQVDMRGWNLDQARLLLPPADSPPGIYAVSAIIGSLRSNRLPFAVGDLPESFEQEPNNDCKQAQEIAMPQIINGRIDRSGDWDVFLIKGRAGDTIVAEVFARRLESPLDSVVELIDAAGKTIGFNDDHEDAGAGINTHHADSYLSAALPADGEYTLRIGDAARRGGPEYAYRLRVGPPRPDFELRVVPSSIALARRSSATVTVHVLRKDGFSGEVRLRLKDAPDGIAASSATIGGSQSMVRMSIRNDRAQPGKVFPLSVEGTAKAGDREITRTAVPAEDRMQAFLWRHLVPAEQFAAIVPDFSSSIMPKREVPPPMELPKPDPSKTAAQPQFTKAQVAGRLRQLRSLFDDWLLTEEFYQMKVAECEAMK